MCQCGAFRCAGIIGWDHAWHQFPPRHNDWLCDDSEQGMDLLVEMETYVLGKLIKKGSNLHPVLHSVAIKIMQNLGNQRCFTGNGDICMPVQTDKEGNICKQFLYKKKHNVKGWQGCIMAIKHSLVPMQSQELYCCQDEEFSVQHGANLKCYSPQCTHYTCPTHAVAVTINNRQWPFCHCHFPYWWDSDDDDI